MYQQFQLQLLPAIAGADQQHSLAAPAFEAPFETLVEGAIEAIFALFQLGKVVCVAFSGGKDSSVLMHLTIVAAKRAKAAGHSPVVIVTSSDTGVENPEVSQLLKSEHRKISAALRAAEIDFEMVVARPTLATSWLVRILGGNKLPTFPGQGADCSVFLKIQPMERERKRLCKERGIESMVTLLGTRFDESQHRQDAMRKRGEMAHKPYLNAKGELLMSPIAFFELDHIWELVGQVRAGQIESYTDFDAMFTLYADSGGTSCAVVSDAITEGLKAAREGCGARTGCWNCVRVERDTSLENMINMDSRYEYMRGLNKLRNLIAHYRWDFSRRYWVMRSVDASGNVRLTPDCYSPAYLLELFRYAATLDAQEKALARKLKISPRFEILRVEEVVAIDAMWSLNGFHKPHTALLEWMAISDGHTEYPVPDVSALDPIQQLRVNHLTEIHVEGGNWDGDEQRQFTGLRNIDVILADCLETRVLNDGREVQMLPTNSVMHVDLESYAMAFDFEIDEIKKRHESPGTDWTDGYRFWVRYGTLSLSPQQVAEHDAILRRTNWRARHGFLGEEGNQRAQQLGKRYELQAS